MSGLEPAVSAAREATRPLASTPAPVERHATEAQHRVALTWLVRMRWGALASQLVAVVATHFVVSIELPLGPMLATLGVVAASNAALAAVGRRAFELADARFDPAATGAMGAALVLDVLALTFLLGLSGGSSNPFAAVYLVYVTLGAVVVGPGWTAAVVAVAAAGYGSLFVGATDGGGHAHHATGGGALFQAHLYGMYVALVASATLIGYFVSRVSTALRAREAELREARREAAHAERLAALTTLCAGAAHELGTPLGTIAITATEIARGARQSAARRLEQGTRPSDEGEGGFGADTHLEEDARRLEEDARLIRSEVDRARAIVDRMAARFGETTGGRAEHHPIARLFEEVQALLRPEQRGRVTLRTELDTVCVPLGPVAQTLSNLVDNALAASPPEASVTLEVTVEADRVRLSVEDHGAGMSPEVLRHARDPFFTTKPAGAGMGLGLYLCEVTASRLGGQLDIRSELGQGTTATLLLPREP